MITKHLGYPRRRGQSLIEFTFVGIPIIFVLISVFEVSRGMWIYHTLAHAVREGVRYASVHGYNCTQNGNTCTVNMGPVSNTCTGSSDAPIAEVIRCAAVGLDPANTNISFYTFVQNGTKTLQGSCTLATGQCAATVFPPNPLNRVNDSRVEIDISTPFNSAISMFWPGANYVSFASGTLGATSADSVRF